MPQLPTGTVTFLFTDVEGSTVLWERNRGQMRDALTRHDAAIEAAVVDNEGVVVPPRGEGDSRFAVFAQGLDGVARLAIAAGQFERAARLFGASQGLLAIFGRRLEAPEAATFDAALAATRAQLDEAAFAAAWAEGEAMTQEQAVAYALEDAPEPSAF